MEQKLLILKSVIFLESLLKVVYKTTRSSLWLSSDAAINLPHVLSAEES